MVSHRETTTSGKGASSQPHLSGSKRKSLVVVVPSLIEAI